MNLTPTEAPAGKSVQTVVDRIRRDGVLGLWGGLRQRDPEAYEAWLEERDMIVITATLMRLSERQLDRIGMSRKTLAIDVDDLAARTLRERRIGRDVLEIVGERNTLEVIAAE